MLKEPVTNSGIELPVPDRIDKHFTEFAFHPSVAREIKERDNYTCLCGQGKKEGLKLHASHKDHNKNNPYYNNPENGTTLCIECHLREHIYLLQKANEDDVNWAWHSVRLLAQGVWDDSFHTKGYRYLHGDTLEEDREKLVNIFDGYELNLFEFVTVKEVH
jgi:hypothetical protein